MIRDEDIIPLVLKLVGLATTLVVGLLYLLRGRRRAGVPPVYLAGDARALRVPHGWTIGMCAGCQGTVPADVMRSYEEGALNDVVACAACGASPIQTIGAAVVPRQAWDPSAGMLALATSCEVSTSALVPPPEAARVRALLLTLERTASAAIPLGGRGARGALVGFVIGATAGTVQIVVVWKIDVVLALIAAVFVEGLPGAAVGTVIAWLWLRRDRRERLTTLTHAALVQGIDRDRLAAEVAQENTSGAVRSAVTAALSLSGA